MNKIFAQMFLSKVDTVEYNNKLKLFLSSAIVADELGKIKPNTGMIFKDGISSSYMSGVPMNQEQLVNEMGLTMDQYNSAINLATARIVYPTTIDVPNSSIEGDSTGITVKIGDIKTKLSLSVYSKLESLLALSSNGMNELYKLVLRYSLLNVSGENFTCIGDPVYLWMEKLSVEVVECFASPFDRSCKLWCSLFEEDKNVGSLGDFNSYMNSLIAKEKDEPKLFVMYPPNIPSIIDSAIQSMGIYYDKHILQGSDSGFIIFLQSMNPTCEAGVQIGMIKSIQAQGYHIYTVGNVPDLTLLFESPVYTPLTKLLASQEQDMYIGKKLFNITRKITNLSPKDLSDIHTKIRVDTSDEEVYTMYKQAVSKKLGTKKPPPTTSKWTNVEDAKQRSASRVREIQSIIDQLVNVKAGYLDIGAADGAITYGIGQASNAMVVYGTDIKNELNPEYGIQFVDDYNTIPSGSLKLVTALMTLHHIKDITEIVTHAHRILMSGGYFIIREHAFTDPDNIGVVMAEHCMYDYVTGSSTYNEALVNNRLYPRSLSEINYLIVSAGFRLLNTVDMNTNDYAYYGYYIKE